LKPQSQIEQHKSQICDLCGASESEFVLATPRLDGPLVRCRRCQLYYVVKPASPAKANGNHSAALNGSLNAAAAVEMKRLGERARELALVEPQIEASEQPWRELMALERLFDLRRFVGGGRLLELGCATGELLLAARSTFEVTGVEADANTSAVARARGLECLNGTLADAQFPAEHFDVAALYHVIEHLPSPQATLAELRRIVKPGGWLALEAPNIATPWFHLLGARWRQFIPDHIFFFTPQTLTRLCEEQGFAVRECRSAGKAMSVRLFLNRLSRFNRPLATAFASLCHPLGLEERTLRLKLGDVMRLYAQRR
jgi:SAM-dependent methyltransferase